MGRPGLLLCESVRSRRSRGRSQAAKCECSEHRRTRLFGGMFGGHPRGALGNREGCSRRRISNGWPRRGRHRKQALLPFAQGSNPSAAAVACVMASKLKSFLSLYRKRIVKYEGEIK